MPSAIRRRAEKGGKKKYRVFDSQKVFWGSGVGILTGYSTAHGYLCGGWVEVLGRQWGEAGRPSSGTTAVVLNRSLSFCPPVAMAELDEKCGKEGNELEEIYAHRFLEVYGVRLIDCMHARTHTHARTRAHTHAHAHTRYIQRAQHAQHTRMPHPHVWVRVGGRGCVCVGRCMWGVCQVCGCVCVVGVWMCARLWCGCGVCGCVCPRVVCMGWE